MKNVAVMISLVPLLVVCSLASCTPASDTTGSAPTPASSDAATTEMSLTPNPERIAFLQDDVRDGYLKRAPWQDITWTIRNKTEVLLDGRWYELKRIDAVAEADLLEFAQLVYKDRWQKRIAEDLVAVMTHMEHAPGGTVALELISRDTGQTVLKTAAMTEDNRWSVWDARNARGD